MVRGKDLERIAWLLRYSELSQHAIAARLGYRDHFVFRLNARLKIREYHGWDHRKWTVRPVEDK